MNYIKSFTLVAGLSLLTFTACQKDNALNQSKIGEEVEVEMPSTRICASHEHNEALMAENPQLKANQEAIEEFTNRFVAEYPNGIQGRAVITIPVVVHVVYKTTGENISQAQVQSQIDILNADYRKLNSEIGSTKPFVGTAADCEVQFVLQQTIRKATNKNSFTTNDAVKKSATGGSDPVSPSTKLNIWVCTLGNSLLGYAQFPGGPAATDGVVCLNKAFGNTGTAAAPFNKGRTATHEVGHWLNLRHIWGDANCGTDQVADTPAHNTANYGCPATGHKSTCSGTPLEQWMNYMDYTDDACMYMFTAGQKSRMQATFAVGGSRAAYKL